jgi:hypothetical protein
MTPWQETAALRDFDPADVRSGSIAPASHQRESAADVRFAPKADLRLSTTGRRRVEAGCRPVIQARKLPLCSSNGGQIKAIECH